VHFSLPSLTSSHRVSDLDLLSIIAANSPLLRELKCGDMDISIESLKQLDNCTQQLELLQIMSDCDSLDIPSSIQLFHPFTTLQTIEIDSMWMSSLETLSNETKEIKSISINHLLINPQENNQNGDIEIPSSLESLEIFELGVTRFFGDPFPASTELKISLSNLRRFILKGSKGFRNDQQFHTLPVRLIRTFCPNLIELRATRTPWNGNGISNSIETLEGISLFIM
jgi:hypothetical protein